MEDLPHREDKGGASVGRRAKAVPRWAAGRRRCLGGPQGEGGVSVDRRAKAVSQWIAKARRCRGGPQGRGGVSVDRKGAVSVAAMAVGTQEGRQSSQSPRWQWEREAKAAA